MEASWYIVIMGTVLAMVASFVACLCGCCKKISRDELIGLSGIVKITNPDSLQNHNGPVAISITRTPSEDNVPLSSVPSSNASTKRLNGANQNVVNPGTATRSLPELPVDAVDSCVIDGGNEVSSNFPPYNSGDTNSDLYATLEEHKISTSTARTKLLQNLVVTTYEQIDEGSIYNKIKREHPYAQVDENANASTSRFEDNPLDARNSGFIEEPAVIPAASAIAGSVAASNELPYMTPPILADHFVDDPQDSAKGYTSITVREPLCHIRSQKPLNQEPVDSHYTILSDDSDEMYAAIQEAYTSGSETYAQIQPVTLASTYEVVPEAPVESSSHRFSMASVHSRQASTSSIASSMTARNSPKEKRQANSPLPKPPDVSPDDMYAKVLKKRKGDNDWCNSRDSVYIVDPEPASSLTFRAGPSNATDSKTKPEYEYYNTNQTDDPDRYACGYEILPERNYEQLNEVIQSAGYETVKEPADSNPGYESLPEPDSLTPGYERIREPANYEKLKYESKEDESDPNYEELKPQPSDEPFHCYATINKSNKVRPSESVAEPDYASLTRQNDSDPSDSFYERINKNSLADDVEKCNNDSNNNHSNKLPKNELPNCSNSTSPTNISDLYSKVQKNVKR